MISIPMAAEVKLTLAINLVAFGMQGFWQVAA